tara:strand:- start:1980 stop:2207 length:228 start_codon:yes stop_codon:yes gene_type:complete
MRRRLLARYRNRLEAFRRVPPRWREAENADIGEQTCLALIAELERELNGKGDSAQQTDRSDGVRGRWGRGDASGI